MPNPAEIEAKLWKALKSDRTAMLGLAGEEGSSQPMTLLVEGDEGGPIYTFTAKDTDLVEALGGRGRAIITFADKGHDLFATIEGELVADNAPETIDRLWNPFVAAWFEGGKSDPNLQLLRFEPEGGKVWLNDNSVFAAVRLMLGRDPKQDYKDKTANLRLS